MKGSWNEITTVMGDLRFISATDGAGRRGRDAARQGGTKKHSSMHAGLRCHCTVHN